MNPAAAAAAIAKLALAHPEIAEGLGHIAEAAIHAGETGGSPWRRAIRAFLRVAAEKAAVELADEISKMVNVRA